MEKNIIKELLKRPVAVNPIFIKITGRIGDGYLLSQIMYWYFSKDKENGQEFFKTDSSWMEELYFSRRELETSKKSLLSLKFIEINKKGKGNKSYYTFCSDNVYEAILTIKGKVKKQVIHKTSFTQNEQSSNCTQKENLGLHKTSIELSTNCANPIYITESTTEILLSKDNNTEPCSVVSDLGNFKNENEETQEEASVVNDEKEESSAGAVEEKGVLVDGEVVYGNIEIFKALKFLKSKCYVDDFKESQKMQRMYTNHIINLKKRIGEKEFVFRLNSILRDDFKLQNCNSLIYLYKELKSFITTPEVKLENEINELLGTQKEDVQIKVRGYRKSYPKEITLNVIKNMITTAGGVLQE